MSQTNSSQRLQGKVAIVTGAASGIGEASARLFARHGALVVIADIQDELGREVAAAVGPDRCTYIRCDVTEEEQVESLVAQTLEKHGRIDVLFSNAGTINPGQAVLDLDLRAMDRLFAVNVRGTAAAVKHVGRAMVAAGVRGSIVCTASVAATVGGYPRVDYILSKHAVLGLVRSASNELGKYGIRVNCVSPYAVATPMLCNLFKVGVEAGEEMFKGGMSLEGAVLKAENVADAALFLASDESALVTGHNLAVDGGFLSRQP